MHNKKIQTQNSHKQREVHETIDQQQQNHCLRTENRLATGGW